MVLAVKIFLIFSWMFVVKKNKNKNFCKHIEFKDVNFEDKNLQNLPKIFPKLLNIKINKN